jgi:hypothetical protein
MTDKLEIAESSLSQAREKVLWDEIKSLRRQLAECQAREKVLIDMAGKWIGDEGWGQADMDEFDRICLAGSSILDAMLKQAKSEQAETCFDRALLKSNGHGVPGILEELRRMAEELK